jgi:hypothetical protein
MSECQLLKTEYANLQKLQTEFELELANAINSGKTEKAQKLKKEITEKLQNLKEKLCPREITANFKNPEKSPEELEKNPETIKFNIPEIIEKQKAFYAGKEGMPTFNEQEINQILRKHKAEFQKEIEIYGYDTIIIVPANLPSTAELNKALIESTLNVAGTSWGIELEEIEIMGDQKTKIILTHKDQYIYENDEANPFLKATLGKNIPGLVLNISPDEWSKMKNAEKKEKNQEAMQKLKQGAGINFETEINGQKKQIKAKGFSLDEYMLIQGQCYEETRMQGKVEHLDEKGWTWLPESRSTSRVVISCWRTDFNHQNVYAHASDYSSGSVGCRFCKIFK